MDWWLLVQRLGFTFDPTDDQLILDYLYPKVREWGGLCDLIGISDQVYTNPPWDYWSRISFPGGEKYYCYTKLKKKNQNQNQSRWARSVGTYGTWHESKSNEICVGNGIIGFKKLMNFKGMKGMMTDDWLMYEFSLPENQTDLVLCVIHKKKNKVEEMGSACGCDTYPELERMSLASYSDLYYTCPASAPAHDDHFQLQALDSEEQETRPSLRNDVLISHH